MWTAKAFVVGLFATLAIVIGINVVILAVADEVNGKKWRAAFFLGNLAAGLGLWTMYFGRYIT